LSLAEAATLVALVRGPSFYDPRKGLERLRARKTYVLDQLSRAGTVSASVVDRARREPIQIRRSGAEGGALHFALALGSGALIPELKSERPLELWTTLDLDLQREVEAIAERARDALEAVDATALSVLVIDNPSGDVLAHVGSPDYFASRAQGSNDGTRALRQPGSTLKPFVYAAAMERLGWTAATLLPDLAFEIETPHGRYRPKNYDGREHGPVRLRVALGSSLNLPALRTAEEVGPGVVLEMLRRFGFVSLTRDAAHYGAAIALGGGEVRLTELAQAYATLAREGEFLPLRFARRARFAKGAAIDLERRAPRRVLDAGIARKLTQILADDAARSPMFGRDSVLAFPFPAAGKTGTSKGFRDNWAVSYTKEVTVVVWVGNFDGRPLVRSSGVSGAGPLLHATMLSAMRGRERAPLLSLEGFTEHRICALSGALPNAVCPTRVREYFLPGRAPTGICSFHEPDPRASGAASRPLERYPERYMAWARAAGRPLAHESAGPRLDFTPPSIDWPASGARFVLDPERSVQEILIQGRGFSANQRVVLRVDGHIVGSAAGPDPVRWQLSRGRHVLTLSQANQESSEVVVEVLPFARKSQRERL
jgi:penicillin-binding protein 1C